MFDLHLRGCWNNEFHLLIVSNVFTHCGRAIRTIKMADPLDFPWRTRRIEEGTRTFHYGILSAPCQKRLYYCPDFVLD